MRLDADALVTALVLGSAAGHSAAHPHVVLPRARPGRRSSCSAPDEVIAAEWVRPADMLARHARGRVTLYPPTWITLHDLAEQPDAGALLDVARIGGLRRFETVARRGANGPMLLWHGDAAYEGSKTPMRTRGMRHPATVSSSRACRGCTPARD